jgi:hypothetical protein
MNGFVPRVCASLILAALLPACDDTVTPHPSPLPAPAPASAPAPVGPTPVPNPVPDAGLLPFPSGTGPSVSGVVFLEGPAGRQRLANFLFSLLWNDDPWDDYPTRLSTDELGRYAATRGEPGLVGIAIPDGAGYHAPCPAGFDNLSQNRTMNIYVVADATLTTTGVPASLPTTNPTVSGTVFERALNETRPVAGAEVFLIRNPSAGSVFSATLTDAAGRFLLCAAPPGIGTGTLMYLEVDKQGYRPTHREIAVGTADRVDLELVPE